MRAPSAGRRGEADPLEDVVRLLALSIRLQLGSQSQAIAELAKTGFGPTRIAEILGTTTGTVNVALQRSRKKQAPKGEAN